MHFAFCQRYHYQPSVCSSQTLNCQTGRSPLEALEALYVLAYILGMVSI
jgi:hypothetical protein